MRWRVDVEPDDGDIRIVRKYLYMPMRIGGEVRWREWANLKQMYNYGGVEGGSWWDTVGFED